MTLTRKFCPLLALAFATVGCGKKITDPRVDHGNSSINYQEISAEIHLYLDSKISGFVQYRLPEPAQFFFPTTVEVVSGTATNQVLEISYGVNEEDDSYYKFKCFYSPANNTKELALNDCVNSSNQTLGSSMYDYMFPLGKNEIIQLKFSNPTENSLSVYTPHPMHWIVPATK